MHFHRSFIAILFTTLLTSTVLTGCQEKSSSQIREGNHPTQPKPEPADQVNVIGEALGVPAAKSAVGADGQVLFSVEAPPLLYSDAGLLVALPGGTTLSGNAQLSQTLWRQTAGPSAQILNSTLPQAQVILPQVKEITDLEFAFAAADSESRVAEARTRVRVSPLEYSRVALKTTTAVSKDKAVITLTLPEAPQSPVTLYYRTKDGTGIGGQDYEATNGQATFNESSPQTSIEIKILNSGLRTEDRYFQVFYATESGNITNNFHVVLRHSSSDAPGQPTEPDPTQPNPNNPTDPTEPTDPTDPTPSPAYTVNYSAAEGGRIQGNSQQTLQPGENGTPVTAIANPGYRFVAWSDGITNAARTAKDVKADLQVTAQFRRNELWLAVGHYGDISVNTGPTTATIDWPAETGKTYNLIVTDDPETEIQNYGVYGAELIVDATPPLDIKELMTDRPVYIALQEDGVLKAWSSFVPRVLGTDGSVQAIAIDADGSRYIGGGFTQVSSFVGGGAALALNNGYSAHVMAGPAIEGEVNAVAPDGYGGWYVGGSFSKIHGHHQQYLIHINAAGQPTDWDHRLLGTVNAILIDEDVIYLGGSFQIIGHVADGSRRYLAAFDRQGNLLPWKPEIYQPVLAIAKNNDVIYAAGVADKQNYVSAFDTKGKKLAFNPQVTSEAARTYVYTIAVINNNIFIGGNFTEANGKSRKYLAAFDIEGNLLPWDPSPDSNVESLTADQDILYVGGTFTKIGKEPRAHLAALDLQGQVLPWNPDLANPGSGTQVKALSVYNGVIYAGGYFSMSNNERRNNLATFDTQGRLLSWNPGANSGINAIAINEGTVYAGGKFTQIGGGHRKGLAALDANGRLLPWSPDISGTVFGGYPSVKSLLIENDIIYTGGHFLRAGKETRNHLAAFDKRGMLLPWNPKLDGVAMVNKLYKVDDIIYVVGGLLWADKRASYGLEAFDTKGQLQTWAPVIGGEVKAILIENGIVYANTQMFQDGILKESFESPENFHLHALALEGDVIYAGGQFVHVGHQGRAGLAAFSLDGKLLQWAPQLSGTVQFASPGVYALATNNNLIYVGGSFTHANGETRGHIASFDEDGNLMPWLTSVDYPVNVLTIRDGIVYAGGAFIKAGHQARRSLATFDLQGNLLNK